MTNKKEGEIQKLVNVTMSLVRQLWLKGIPVSIGDFEFTTARRQVLLKLNNKKRFKKPYKAIIFQPREIVIKTHKGTSDKVKRFAVSKDKIKSQREPTIRD